MWKPIIDYENYEVNELGEVRRDGKILKALIVNEYLKINLCKDGNKKQFYIHRLIALHFILNPDCLPCVDHINGIKTDNRIENLRWVTKQQNGFNRNCKGYTINKYGKYCARIYLNAKRTHLGTFETEEEAHQAYLTKKEELHGLEFIRQ